MIKPTVGRMMWYYPAVPSALVPRKEQPFAATVAYVWGDRCVNIGYLDHNGMQSSITSVLVVQEGDPIPETAGYCVWMPYQIGQAKKNEGSPA